MTGVNSAHAMLVSLHALRADRRYSDLDFEESEPPASMLNYRHLHYFWVVAKEGGFARAAARLDMAIQTISTQVHELEQALGHPLLKSAGRTVVLTEAGQAAFARAETIFQLGRSIPDAVQAAAGGGTVRLAVGMSDGLSRLAARTLLARVLATPGLRLVCHDGEFEALLADLALRRLDLVLASQPAPHNPSLRLTSERVAVSPVEWYGPATLVHKAQVEAFPRSLGRLPVLLPTGQSALRPALDRWLEAEGLRPAVAGEFEDCALMAVFAASGMGVFPIGRPGTGRPDHLLGLRSLRRLGACEGVNEEVHAIRSRRGLQHPLVVRLMEGGR